MKFQFIFSALFCVLTFTTNSLPTQANDNNDDNHFINSYEEDITGDGLREYIKLQGTLLTKQSAYYRNIWLDITGPFSLQWKVSLSSGYNPSLTIVDLTNNETSDLLFQSARDEELGQYNYQLYTITKGSIRQIALPTHHKVQLVFLNDFKFQVKTPLLQKPIVFDISKEQQLDLVDGLYNEQGKLLINKQFAIEARFTFQPTLISKTKGYGLRSTEYLFGLNKHDVLGVIESLWYFENDKWINLQTTVNVE